jgi:hypothetical protein
MIVLTQIYGIGLGKRARQLISVLFVAGTGLYYALTSNVVGLNEVIRIPVFEFGLVFVLYLIFLGVYGLVRLFSKDNPSPAGTD